ncbi:hypothetical protein GCM10011378_10280 [Hymenobacter glacieicola]|uniref:Uncharacterized protein n=1 Tax=Hymenobacter glacieicola TaxID=1562124 RepID=A0ABQ1WNL4_9BACT|nr:hypothetical protein GCM10011378_10280 [Hymenobacter glacieicola]
MQGAAQQQHRLALGRRRGRYLGQGGGSDEQGQGEKYVFHGVDVMVNPNVMLSAAGGVVEASLPLTNDWHHNEAGEMLRLRSA